MKIPPTLHWHGCYNLSVTSPIIGQRSIGQLYGSQKAFETHLSSDTKTELDKIWRVTMVVHLKLMHGNGALRYNRFIQLATGEKISHNFGAYSL